MNVARLNFSHGNHYEKSWKLKNLKEAMLQRPAKKCAILLDLKGPEIRTNKFIEGFEEIQVTKGQSLTIVADPDYENTATTIGCSYTSLPESVKIGSQILIADGSLSCEVKKIEKDRVVVECLNNFTMGSRKNMSLPGANVDLPTLTEKDIEDIQEFGVKHASYIAASFVRSSQDIK